MPTPCAGPGAENTVRNRRLQRITEKDSSQTVMKRAIARRLQESGEQIESFAGLFFLKGPLGIICR